MRRSEFERFFNDSKDPCFRALLASVHDAHTADDLLAESFARAWAHWRQVRRHPSPRAWVVRTALNLHRDQWRTANRPRRSLRTLGPSHDGDPASASRHVDPLLLAAIASLPERQREVIVHRVLLDLSTEATAAALGIQPGTVTTHLHRALATLRAALTEGAFR